MIYQNYNLGGRKATLGFKTTNPPPVRRDARWFNNHLFTHPTRPGIWVFPQADGTHTHREIGQDFWLIRIQGN